MNPSEKSFYAIGDEIQLECLIEGNPAPDIRWYHRFSSRIDQEIDLTTEYSQLNLKRKELKNDIWFIKQEQFNATRWKTSLFIQVNA